MNLFELIVSSSDDLHKRLYRSIQYLNWQCWPYLPRSWSWFPRRCFYVSVVQWQDTCLPHCERRWRKETRVSAATYGVVKSSYPYWAVPLRLDCRVEGTLYYTYLVHVVNWCGSVTHHGTFLLSFRLRRPSLGKFFVIELADLYKTGQMPLQTYLIDAYTVYAASALAASTVLRCIFGAALPLAGQPLYDALGLGWGNSLLGFIALAMAPVPFLLSRYGERLRKKYPVNFWLVARMKAIVQYLRGAYSRLENTCKIRT